MPGVHTGAAIRHVRQECFLSIPSRGLFQVPLPYLSDKNDALIQQEEPRRELLLDVWKKSVCPGITKLVKARNSIWSNGHMKEVVFQSGMDNLCREFSQRTETVLVQFSVLDEAPTRSSKKGPTYRLRVARLTRIRDDLRYARSYLAEIPCCEEVTAEVVPTDSNDTSGTLALPEGQVITQSIHTNLNPTRTVEVYHHNYHADRSVSQIATASAQAIDYPQVPPRNQMTPLYHDTINVVSSTEATSLAPVAAVVCVIPAERMT